jgi:hypothetical protein
MRDDSQFDQETISEPIDNQKKSVDLTHHETQTHRTSIIVIFKFSEDRLRRLNSRNHSENNHHDEKIKEMKIEQKILQVRYNSRSSDINIGHENSDDHHE